MESTSTATTNRDASEGGDAIAVLEADHRKIGSLLKALPDAAPDQRTSVLNQLKPILVLHCATEENIVYPAIHEVAKRPVQAGRLYHEQDDAQVAVWALSKLSSSDDDFVAKATKLRDAVLAHAKDEEENEFPKLREAAGDRLASITDEVRKFRSTFSPSPGAN